MSSASGTCRWQFLQCIRCIHERWLRATYTCLSNVAFDHGLQEGLDAPEALEEAMETLQSGLTAIHAWPISTLEIIRLVAIMAMRGS